MKIFNLNLKIEDTKTVIKMFYAHSKFVFKKFRKLFPCEYKYKSVYGKYFL